MTLFAGIQLLLYVAIILLLAKPLGLYINHIMHGTTTSVKPLASPVENGIYRFCGISNAQEMNWKQYAVALLLFNILGVITVYALQRLQIWLPLNPENLANVTPDSAFNTAISFATNTNWQGYVGESTMSYLTQMLGLAVQNFFSAATGISVAFVLIRGFAANHVMHLGNFWVDITRITLYLLLPLSIIIAILFMSQGVIQNFSDYITVNTLQGGTQTLPMGPVASQEAIKMVGTNGGGFFNANSAHPFENPTPLSNFIQMLSIFLIPAALCYTFGKFIGDTRQGWTLLITMTIIFVSLAILATVAEQQGNPLFTTAGIDQIVSDQQAGGNMEGKETRFGISASALFATITTAASCGAVNAMHDSFTPMGGFVPLLLIQLGEVIFGGVGAGLYGILMLAILAVFVAGLMIGRTPEYLGKKIESFEMKMMAITILIPPFLILIGTGLALMIPQGTAGIFNPSAHGFSEVLYAFSSATNNNGSAFAGISVNTPFYNTLLAIAMWFGRFAVIIPVIAIAGSLAEKRRIAVTSGTLPTHGTLFIALLIGVIVLLGALTYLPALALGPIIEHLLLNMSS